MQNLATNLQMPRVGLLGLPMHLESEASRQNFLEWSVAQVLDAFFPYLKLRDVVRKSELLANTPLHSLANNPSGLASFLFECRQLPSCGDIQIKRLHEVLVSVINIVQSSVAEGQGENTGAMFGDSVSDLILSRPHEIVTYPAEGVFYPYFVEDMQPVYHKMWHNQLDMPFVYLPTSVPEFAKTPAILSAEIGRPIGAKTRHARLGTIHEAVGVMPQAKGAIILDSHALRAIFGQQGRYEGLSKEDVALQRIMLQSMLDILPDDVECLVVDHEKARLAPGAIIGTDVIIHGFGGYTVYTSPTFLAHMQTLCDAALRDGECLSAFLQLY
ncbi:MAG: hypothetical protein LAT78_11065 [Roseinatronobacter sp.]|jgi:hypothetical protein|nr:hypothetical protein [Roseinatronobacter sp.]